MTRPIEEGGDPALLELCEGTVDNSFASPVAGRAAMRRLLAGVSNVGDMPVEAKLVRGVG